LSKSNPNKLVAGAQDNGTEMLTNSTWDAIMGGDGMECAIDHYDEDIIYAEYQYGGLRKTYNGGYDWDNIKPVPYEGAWNTPYAMHPINSNLLVIGYDEVYKTTSGGAVWDSISFNVSNGQAIRSIALAASDEDYIYAASYSKIKVTKDGGQNWTYIKPGLANYNMTDIAVSTNNADRAWVTFSDYNNVHKVYETNDAGNSWTNISGSSLPALPVNCIVYQGGANDDLYIGTDVGVYYKDNTMTDWVPFNNGLPNVIINELEIHYDEGTISAATFGRGVWESPLNTISNVKNDITQNLSVKIFPNPAKNKITILSKMNNLSVCIYSVTGQKIIHSKDREIDVSKLKKGYYIIKVFNDQFSEQGPLVIE
jgi:photosystem II stability/assembly factor-like uncharacterized protein